MRVRLPDILFETSTYLTVVDVYWGAAFAAVDYLDVYLQLVVMTVFELSW